MAQQLPNYLEMAAELRQSSQALADAAAAHNNLSVEIAPSANVPAIQAWEIKAMLTTIDQRLQAMDLCMQARFYNVSCMLSNGRVTQPKTPLHPLRNITTNQPIPNFPENLDAVEDIECHDNFRSLLDALGEQTNPQWTLQETRQAFREAIGCHPI
ncbi:hypothetical protein BGZ60DRAFT_153073 [Tricladium varicosporioides]|nr:hypothetical protein BGZ60DRAFT_153073 [Hymenoscyphus varicosporioides]